MVNLVLTVIGTDRAGLVAALSGVVAEHGGNWDRSQMARLGGKFAGIVLISVPEANHEALLDALAPLGTAGVLDVAVERAGPPDGGASPEAVTGTQLSLTLMGQDRPGIVYDISEALAAHGVSIEDLETETQSAPMAGGQLFRAEASLRLPSGVTVDELRGELEALADRLLVDLDLT